MDLRLYARVLWRFKFLVLVGIIAAGALAVLSYARVSFAGGRPTLTYRHAVTYGSAETLLVTQQGFPEGRSTFPFTVTKYGPISSFADPTRFSSLADFYAYLANSDAVGALAARKVGHDAGVFTASPVISHVGNDVAEPLLQIQGLATSPSAAVLYARAGSASFREYLAAQQAKAGVPRSQRVLVTVLNGAAGAAVVVPRKKTLPIVVFTAVLAATLALALILENLRPRIKVVEDRVIEREPLEGRRSTG